LASVVLIVAACARPAIANDPTGGEGVADSVAADAALEITSFPPGAAAFVDGQLRGETPLRIETLSSGSHRVTVFKEGYRKVRRVAALIPGQTTRFDVALAPERRGFRRELLAAGGAALVGAAGYVAFHKETRNQPPTPAIVRPSSEIALSGATEITLTALGATDPEGDPLTYEWSFCDVQSAIRRLGGTTLTHTFVWDGVCPIRLTVSDGEATATTDLNITVRAMTGRWSGSRWGMVLDLTQEGATLSGDYMDSVASKGYVEAESYVQHPYHVTINVGANFGNTAWSGTIVCDLNGSLDVCAGTLANLYDPPLGSIVLTRE